MVYGFEELYTYLHAVGPRVENRKCQKILPH
jgi:hypothetical protein